MLETFVSSFFEALELCIVQLHSDQRPNSLNINANFIHFFTRIIYGHGRKEFQKDTYTYFDDGLL